MQIYRSKEMGLGGGGGGGGGGGRGGGMQVSFAPHFKGSKRYTDILKKEIKQQSLLNQCSAKHCI